MTKRIIRTPKDWQLNPDNIETVFVQFWRNGVMITSQMTNEAAKKAVKAGTAFVISGQAIGAMIDGKMSS